MVPAEDFVMHRYECIDSLLIDYRTEFNSGWWRGLESQCCDLTDQKRLGGLWQEAGSPQSSWEIRRLIVGIVLPLPRVWKVSKTLNLGRNHIVGIT